jgi:hypothetical protein
MGCPARYDSRIDRQRRDIVEDVRRTAMRRFEGKSVLVTGGASGIGEACRRAGMIRAGSVASCRDAVS